MTLEELNKLLESTGGVQGIGSILNAIGSSQQNAATRAQTQVLNAYNAQANARNAAMNFLGGQLNAQTERAGLLANVLPLGAEQKLVQQNAKRYGMIGALADRPLPTAYGGVFNPFPSIDRSYWSPASSAATLAQNRKIAAAIEPNFQFDSMGAYGLGDTSAQDKSVADYQRTVGATRSAQEQSIANMLSDQMTAARNLGQPGQYGSGGSGGGGSKGPGVWSTLGKIGLAAAPFVAGGMKNISPQTMKLIQAASQAGTAAMGGGGIAGAAMGALSGYSEPPIQPTGIGVKNAVLNPRAMTTIAAAGLPGAYSALGQMAASRLPGYRPPTSQLAKEMLAREQQVPASLPTTLPGAGAKELGLDVRPGGPTVPPSLDLPGQQRQDLFGPITFSAPKVTNAVKTKAARRGGDFRNAPSPAPPTATTATPNIDLAENILGTGGAFAAGFGRRPDLAALISAGVGGYADLARNAGQLPGAVRDIYTNLTSGSPDVRSATLSGLGTGMLEGAQNSLLRAIQGGAVGALGAGARSIGSRVLGRFGNAAAASTSATNPVGLLEAGPTPRQLGPATFIPAGPAPQPAGLLPPRTIQLGPGTTVLPSGSSPIAMGPGQQLTQEGFMRFANAYKTNVPGYRTPEIFNLLTRFVAENGGDMNKFIAAIR